MTDISIYYQGFESERLQFRKASLKDVEAWAPFFEDQASLALLNLPNIDPDTAVMAKRWIQTQLDRYEQQHFGQLAMIEKESNSLIGMMGFKYMDYKGNTYPELMCSIKKSYRRKGYSTEATKRFVEFAFEQKLTDRVLFMVHQENIGSQKNLEGCGYKQIDLLVTPERAAYIYEASLLS